MNMNMSITSFYFLCFYVIVLLLYYILPKKVQWGVLLLGGLGFCLLSGQGWLFVFPAATGGICFVAGKIIENGQTLKQKKAGLWLAIAGTLGVLIVLKYAGFLTEMCSLLLKPLGSITGWNLLVPLGISYYTLTMLGYVIDLYYGIGKSAPHFGIFLLFGTYFPTLISGPFMNYRETGKQFEREYRFDYRQVTFGMQRMLWGFFKKLVISERLSLVVGTVFNSYEEYSGFLVLAAAAFFVLQLYTDFSGCMDIVLGLSETFGLSLPENFRTPFFSGSIAEFWRRWHITLGIWMKNYVFYPVLRSKVFTVLGAKLRSWFGKKRGKQLTTWLGMFLLWFTVGLWHGPAWKYVLGSGLIHWFYIVLGEIFEPVNKKIRRKLGVGAGKYWYRGFQSVRTFLLVALAFVFFRAESADEAVRILIQMTKGWSLQAFTNGSMWGTLFSLGLDWIEFTIAIVSLLILLVVSVLQEKGVKIRESISKKRLPVRWAIWYALLFYTILLGYYGPGYSAAEFIYQGF